MPAIADAVTSLENDHTAALAKIDALNSTNGALLDMVNSLKADKAAMQTQLDTLNTHVKSVNDMVENVAKGALTMLQTVRAQAEAGAKVVVADAASLAAKVEAKVSAGIADAIGLLPETAAPPVAPAAPAPVVHDATLTTDSGDEQPAKTALPPAIGLMPAAPPAPPAAKPTVIEKIETAVDRMLHHSSGSQTQIRRPVDLTMHVDHDDGGLPIFLRRGTVFQRGDQATL
jgi:hypothetical protein